MRACRAGYAAWLLCAGTWAGAALAAVSPAPLPLASFGDESVAASDDARAYTVNPAALGQRYPSELLLAYARHDRGHEWLNGVATWRRLGFGYSRQPDSLTRAGLGFSLGGGPLRLGWAADVVAARAPQRERDLDDRLGLLYRPLPWASAGATVAHVFEPEFRGRRLNRTYTLGLGLRPLAWSRARAHDAGTRLTLTGDLLMVEGGERHQARVRVGGALEPVRGLELRIMAADHGALQFGVSLRGVGSSLHAVQARRNGARAYDGYAFSSHSGEDRVPTALRALRRVAHVRVGGVLADEPLGGGVLGGGGAHSAAPVHAQLERALHDPLTRGVFLELGGAAGMAQLEELRPRFEQLKQAGKPVVAYMQYGGSRGDLYLASVATRAYASPAAEFVGLGLRAERRYYRQMLARFGVKLDRVSVGDYKSAYRNYSVDSTPPADTVVIQRMLTQRQELFVGAVSRGRGIAPEQLLPVLDGRDHDARTLARLGIIDSVGWREDALAELGRLTGLGRKPRLVDLRRARPARLAWNTPTRIAVIYAGGAIVDGTSGNDPMDGGVMGRDNEQRRIGFMNTS